MQNHHGHKGHSHHHHGELKGKKLLWVSLLNLAITIAQFIGGIISNSLALLSDAIHNLADSSAIFIAYIANRIAGRKPDDKRTFGYKRFEILAALFNAVVLISICIFLIYESYKRFMHPEPIAGKIMLWVAVIGLLANLISVLILEKEKQHNLNVRSAYLHLLGDTLSSVAVIVGALLIWKFGITWIDPAITVLVSVYIIYHSWKIVKESADILMQATPPGMNSDLIKTTILTVNGVRDVHHIHFWRLDDEQFHFEGHVELVNDISVSESQKIGEAIEKMLSEMYGISHVTLQFEYQANHIYTDQNSCY